MTIKYTYLDPDSPFTAEALNTRFDASIGTLQGVNNLLPEDLAVGAFRHNHVPRLIHQDGMSLDDLTEPTSTARGVGNAFSVSLNTAFTSTNGSPVTDGLVLELNYFGSALNPTPAVNVTMDLADSSENVGAIIVLANICVTRITRINFDGSGSFPQEDRDHAPFYIELEDSAGASEILAKSWRTTSPRVTIDYGNSPTLNPPCGPLTVAGGDRESLTNQDVAIRTVITPQNLEDMGLVDVNKIRLMSGIGATVAATTKVSKGNLTAIPIHAKLVSS